MYLKQSLWKTKCQAYRVWCYIELQRWQEWRFLLLFWSSSIQSRVKQQQCLTPAMMCNWEHNKSQFSWEKHTYSLPVCRLHSAVVSSRHAACKHWLLYSPSRRRHATAAIMAYARHTAAAAATRLTPSNSGVHVSLPSFSPWLSLLCWTQKRT